MERMSSLPLPVRIAIGGGIAVVMFAILYMTALRGDGLTTVESYPTKKSAEAAQWRLSQATTEGAGGIAAQVREHNGRWELRAPAATAEAAKQVLNVDDLGVGMRFSCPEAGALATSAAKRAAELCTKTREIEGMLSNETAIEQAYVILTPQESGGFGAAESAEASIQIVPKDGVDVSGMGAEWARMVDSTMPMLTADSIYIRTRDGETLYDPRGGTSGAGAERCQNASSNIHDLTRCVNSQVASEIEAYVVDIVRDPDKVSVGAWVVLSGSARQVTASDLAPVILNSRSSTQESSSGGTRSVTRDESKDRTTATEVTSETTLPGMVEQVNVSVTLTGVDRSIERTVRDQISALLSSDASVSVRNVPAEEGTDAADAAADPAASETDDAGAETTATVPEPELVKTDQRTLLMLLGVVVTVLVGVLAVLWRRSSRLQTERRVFEEEFRNDMTRFQSVASRNPDELAREIESWLQGQGPQRGTGS